MQCMPVTPMHGKAPMCYSFAMRREIPAAREYGHVLGCLSPASRAACTEGELRLSAWDDWHVLLKLQLRLHACRGSA